MSVGDGGGVNILGEEERRGEANVDVDVDESRRGVESQNVI